jgi:hypothetical protein
MTTRHQRPGQRVIVNGKHWILTGNPTLSISQPLGIPTTKTTQGQESPTKRKKSELEAEDSSDDSVTPYYKCHIPPDINESNAESVAREEETQKRILTRKQKSFPCTPSHLRTNLTLTTNLIASQNPARHYGFAVSRTPATTEQSNERNKLVSVD